MMKQHLMPCGEAGHIFHVIFLLQQLLLSDSLRLRWGSGVNPVQILSARWHHSADVPFLITPYHWSHPLQQKRKPASVERSLHGYRQVSGRELLRQVWSNNRLFVSRPCFSFSSDTICCENKMFRNEEETVKLDCFQTTSWVWFCLSLLALSSELKLTSFPFGTKLQPCYV